MDDEESNIKKARPKQGLETGGLISGKERVAQAYAKSLSGAEGPVAQFDAVDEIARLQVQQAFDRMTFSSPAGSPAIFGRNGHYAIAAPRARDGRRDDPVVSQFLQRWDLIPYEDTGNFVLRAPLLVASLTDIDKEIVITNAAISLSAGQWVVLRCDNVKANPMSFTLALRPDDDGLVSYTFDSNDDLDEVYLPLHKIESTPSPLAIALGTNIFATAYVGGGALTLASWFVFATDTAKLRAVPRLSPL